MNDSDFDISKDLIERLHTEVATEIARRDEMQSGAANADAAFLQQRADDGFRLRA